MVSSTGDPILDAVEEINQITERLRTSVPTFPRPQTFFRMGLLKPGRGFVSSSSSSTTASLNQQVEDDANTASESSEDDDSVDNEDALVNYTDAEVAIAADRNKHRFLSFFDSIHEDTINIQSAPDPGPIPGLRSTVQLFPHQIRAVAAALSAQKSRFQGMILADPSGLGKTLSALSTIAASTAKAGSVAGPCVIVTPRSCCDQWMKEIDLFFKTLCTVDRCRHCRHLYFEPITDSNIQDQMPAICFLGGALNPVELWKYKVVVTSYSYVVSEVTRKKRFLDGISSFKKGKTTRLPKRPHLVLLSGIHEQAKPIGEWLVLDEAHAIKNTESRTYHAISKLRQNFKACLLMTSTPLDNKWEDSYALLTMLNGHPLTSFLLFKAAFVERLDSAATEPAGKHKDRYTQLLDATTLRRPQATIQDMLP